MYCANCGASFDVTPMLCEQCYTDPCVPMERVDRALETFRFRRPSTPLDGIIRHPEEGIALGGAILLGLFVAILLAGLTFGIYAGILVLTMVLSQLEVRRQLAGAVDLQRWQDPRVHRLVKLACYRLGVPLPRTVVLQSPMFNAFTTGFWDYNVVVVYSALVEHFTPHELLTVIGHEVGHIKYRHVTWMTLTHPTRAASSVNLIGILIGWAFNGWALRAEYTADRAGLVAGGALEPALRAEVRLATGQDPGERPDIRTFIERASRGDPLENLAEYMGDHPFPHNRVAALVRTWNDPAWQRKLLSTLRPGIGPTLA